MRILDLDQVASRTVTQFGSSGFRVGRVGAVQPGHVTVLSLDAGGHVGRHPAVGGQLLVVLSGTARVVGGAGEAAEIGPGQAVWWDAGEDHETRAADAVSALVVEGSWLGEPGADLG